VILGAYEGAHSPIDAPPMTFLHVTLQDGQRWIYRPSPGHAVAWAAVYCGRLLAPSPITTGEVAIFEQSEQPIDLVAEGETRFVIGSAPPHGHDLVLGKYSVHTSPQALLRGEAEIRRIGQRLLADGTLQPRT